MKIALFSDSHGLHDRINIPMADILIFAGDMTNCRTTRDDLDFNRFLGSLPHHHKIVIGGNHDFRLARDREKTRNQFTEAVYLEDEAVQVCGVTVYGTPWQPLFNNHSCDAFALSRGRAIREKWAMISDGVDILVTHTPPAGILDLDGPVCHGCSDLSSAVAKVEPKYHVFGHIHSCHGMVHHNSTSFINCNVQGGNGTLRNAILLDYDSGEILM